MRSSVFLQMSGDSLRRLSSTINLIIIDVIDGADGLTRFLPLRTTPLHRWLFDVFTKDVWISRLPWFVRVKFSIRGGRWVC